MMEFLRQPWSWYVAGTIIGPYSTIRLTFLFDFFGKK
jgi:hypothetical protein